MAADLTLAGGSVADPDAAPGVASLTASLLTRGTAKRSAKEIGFTLDALGATLDARAFSDRTDVTTDAVTARFPAALALLAQVVRQPAFAAGEIALAKQRAISGITLQSGSPSMLGEPRRAARAVCRCVRAARVGDGALDRRDRS